KFGSNEMMFKQNGKIASWCGALIESVRAIRAPLCMAVVTLSVLCLPEQMREVYRILVLDTAGTETAAAWRYACFALTSLLALSSVFWFLAGELTPLASERFDFEGSSLAKRVLRWSPRLLASTPFLGAALGIWSSSLPLAMGQEPAEIIKPAIILQSRIPYAASLSAVLAAVVVGSAWAIEIFFPPNVQSAARTRRRQFFLISNWVLFPAIGLISITLFSFHPVTLPQFFGVFPIF